MFSFTGIQFWVALGIAGVVSLVAWDYASTKSALATRKAEVTTLKASLKAVQTTNTLNLEAMRLLDKSCLDQAERFLKLRDIDKIIKESATPIDDALKFDPNAGKK